MGTEPLDEKVEAWALDLVRQMKAAGWDGQEYTISLREEADGTFVDVNWEEEEDNDS
jgi:hypothetical protein